MFRDAPSVLWAELILMLKDDPSSCHNVMSWAEVIFLFRDDSSVTEITPMFRVDSSVTWAEVILVFRDDSSVIWAEVF